MTHRKVCWNPAVNRAAWAVLTGIVLVGLNPSQTDKLARKAKEAVPEALTSIFLTGFGEDAQAGIALATGNGTIFLLVPEFRGGESDGWQGPPRVILEGEAAADDAAEVLSRLARHLNAEV